MIPPAADTGSVNRERLVLLVALGLLVAAAVLPGIGMRPGYLDFADRRMWWFISNAGDVLSNLPFALIGFTGLWMLCTGHHTSQQSSPDGRSVQNQWVWRVSFAGLITIWLGSSYFHLNPSEESLVWDQIGMSIAFAGILGLACSDAISPRAALPEMVLLLVTGMVTVWIVRLSGNLLPWSLLQGAGMVLLVIAAVRHQPVTGIRWFWMVVFYALAKVCEMLDADIFLLTSQLISGHTVKHLLSGVACLPLLQGLRR